MADPIGACATSTEPGRKSATHGRESQEPGGDDDNSSLFFGDINHDAEQDTFSDLGGTVDGMDVGGIAAWIAEDDPPTSDSQAGRPGPFSRPEDPARVVAVRQAEPAASVSQAGKKGRNK